VAQPSQGMSRSDVEPLRGTHDMDGAGLGSPFRGEAEASISDPRGLASWDRSSNGAEPALPTEDRAAEARGWESMGSAVPDQARSSSTAGRSRLDMDGGPPVLPEQGQSRGPTQLGQGRNTGEATWPVVSGRNEGLALEGPLPDQGMGLVRWRPTWRMVPGVSTISLAFDVARRCAVPEPVILRAEELYEVSN
jgi:hypothetical protein